MKKFLFIGLFVLMVFLFAPISIIENNKNKTNNSITRSDSLKTSTQDEPTNTYRDLSEEDITYIATYASNFLDEKDNLELKKAVLAICKNNYIYYQTENKTPEKLKVSNYSDKLFDELSTMVNRINISLLYGDEIVYIPILRYSGISTSISEEYPYIVSVASPWEAFGENFSRFADYPCGVSVCGMSFLAESGLIAKELLCWYLPEFTVK